MAFADVTLYSCHISTRCFVVLIDIAGEECMSYDSSDEIVDAWTQHRAYVVDLAFRMLGNIHDAEDVVQDAFGRLLAQDVDAIEDVRGWLVVVVSRLCLDQLRSARRRHDVT